MTLGYEYLADGGFLLRVGGGITYVDSMCSDTHVLPALNLILGFKLW